MPAPNTFETCNESPIASVVSLIFLPPSMTGELYALIITTEVGQSAGRSLMAA